MKATIDIPDALYRRVKAKSALEGRPIRGVTVELFRGYVGEVELVPTEAAAEGVGFLIDGRPVPGWFGQLKKYTGQSRAHDMDAIRASIARGLAGGPRK